MHNELLPVLRCPVSGAPLDLHSIEAGNASAAGTVKTGLLTCTQSGLWYPIINHVPILLTFKTRLVEDFAARHAPLLAQFAQFSQPDLEPMPGERSVQTTFTEEWGDLGDDAHTFVYSDDQLLALHRDVWLRMSDDERAQVRSVLDVGCGFGKEARILAELFPNAIVLAADLNLALLAAGPELVRKGRVHPVVASLFRLPFAPQSVEHVHSQGVIHHTYSTKAAFDAISRLVAPGGSLFVWVYAAEDAHVVAGLRGWLVWLYWVGTHRIFRPILSRSPAFVRNGAMHVIAGILHPILARRGGKAGWRYANTLHGLRDAFTPRYAHQHGFNEVIGWFEEAGFVPRLQSPLRYRQLMGSRLLGVGAIGRRGEVR
jgi:SAM-dependent methyltransferase/uncharacterized protein YbaR (Trm112 family)